jgi:hypothetical protein
MGSKLLSSPYRHILQMINDDAVLSLVSCLPPTLPAFVVVPSEAGSGNLRGGVVGGCTGKISTLSLFFLIIT